MKREKFVYNTQTLRYEKVKISWKTRLLQTFSFLCAVLLASAIVVFVADTFFSSPKEKMLMREIDQMHNQYTVLTETVDLQAEVLNDLQDRDNNVYRMIFGMSPVDSYEQKMGVGGSEKYKHLTKYSNTSDILFGATQKVDKLGRQIVAQSKSLDDIVDLAKDREVMFASIPSIKPVHEGKLKRKMVLMSGFGMRLHPIHKIRKMHQGIDFSAPKGTAIQATGDGKVIKVLRSKSGYGNNLTISHGYGYQTLYAHMTRIDVKLGQKIKKGQKIGTIGSTGTSTAPHLHYEVRFKGKPINPIHFCMDGLNPEEYKELVNMASIANQSFD